MKTFNIKILMLNLKMSTNFFPLSRAQIFLLKIIWPLDQNKSNFDVVDWWISIFQWNLSLCDISHFIKLETGEKWEWRAAENVIIKNDKMSCHHQFLPLITDRVERGTKSMDMRFFVGSDDFSVFCWILSSDHDPLCSTII